MALKVNGARLHTHVNRIFGGGNVAGIYGLGVNALRSRLERNAGVFNNFSSGEHAIFEVTEKAGIPNGYRHPYGWKMPRVGGALSSRSECVVTVAAEGDGALGLGGVGTATITLNGAATGGLIAGAVGSATITFNAAASITASVSAVGTSTIVFSASANIGALGFMVGQSNIAIDGTLQPYAIGHMVGSTVDDSELTPESIAASVWNSTASSYNSAGTMGEKLNDAGSASNPWTEVIESGYTAAEILRLLAAVAAGSATDLNGNPSFTGLDGSTVRVEGTIVGGERTITGLDGS